MQRYTSGVPHLCAWKNTMKLLLNTNIHLQAQLSTNENSQGIDTWIVKDDCTGQLNTHRGRYCVAKLYHAKRVQTCFHQRHISFKRKSRDVCKGHCDCLCDIL